MKVFKSVLPTGLWGVLMAIMLLLPSCAEHPYQQGQILYENFCSSCHMSDGSGLEGVIPPLAGADYWRDNQASLACLIRYGITDTIIVNGKTYNNPMAGIPNLTEFEIANIINYVNQAWGHELAVVRVSDLQKQLDECLPDYYPKK